MNLAVDGHQSIYGRTRRIVRRSAGLLVPDFRHVGHTRDRLLTRYGAYATPDSGTQLIMRKRAAFMLSVLLFRYLLTGSRTKHRVARVTTAWKKQR